MFTWTEIALEPKWLRISTFGIMARLLFRMPGMCFGMNLVRPGVVTALRDAVSRSSVYDFWSIWSENAEAGLF